MKVLFAVSNEEISEAIVKRYQKDYKEIISYKNVYYFNAILKELQKEKNYDRIVISEELEAFTSTQYNQIDKFIFDKLDNISDEASNLKGDDIPIILICSDRREKSEEMLVKIFGIGIYNALIGNDRSVDNVCKLLNKPRAKKEAKTYYKIDTDDVSYQAENENDVSEIEIQNILAHYKRLGKDEKKYVDSFNNIASQYNDIQLRIISKFLPLNVRAVLEEKSSKYQEIMSYVSNSVPSNLKPKIEVKEKEEGTSEKLLKTGNNKRIISNPIVIPSAVNMNSNRKLAKNKVEKNTGIELEDGEDLKIDSNLERRERDKKEDLDKIDFINNELNNIGQDEEILENNDNNEKTVEQEVGQAPKRGRGRPRKNPVQTENVVVTPKRGRGRPRKNPLPEDQEELVLPGLDTENNLRQSNEKDILESQIDNDDTILPGFNEEEQEETILPGFDEQDEQEKAILPGFDEQEETILPGFDDKDETILPKFEEHKEKTKNYVNKSENNLYSPTNNVSTDISNLLTSNKKVACFIGTSKNGTSFIVNNLAEVTSKMGIDTAILDLTQNRNAYYIYTKNEESLRKIAMDSINNLLNGEAKGIEVNKNITVYTSLPDETEGIENAGLILKSLLSKHSLILIDCDFKTPLEYFEKAQEIYLVQSFDILTIQPLTAFLRELKAKNILKPSNLKIVLNKAVKLRGVNDKTIIGGMAYYNDPAMSFMTELFNKEAIKYITIPFNEEVYTKYLENIIDCEVSIKGYPKNIVQILNELANMVYPSISGKSTYVPPKLEKSAFTPQMNSTLDQMKNKY